MNLFQIIFFSLNNKNEIIELFEFISNPKIASVILSKIEGDKEKTIIASEALIRAAENGHKEIARLLFEQSGIDVNAKNNDGYTPLHRAARNGHVEVVQLLLSQKIKELVGGQEEFDRYAEIRRQKEEERERNNQTTSDNLANATTDFDSKTPQQAPYPSKK